jgi:hypothetical protein
LNQFFGKSGQSILVATRRPMNNIKVLIFDVTEFLAGYALARTSQRFTCTACGKRGEDVHPDFNWSAGWAIAKAITGLTNCRSQPLKKRWRARNDVAL